VQEGIEQPSSVNPSIINKIQKHKTPKISVNEYLDGILSGNRTVLSRAITLIESVLPEHQYLAQQIIEKCLPYSGNSIRLGITGVPGVGKSTFIEALGRYLTRNGNKLAVLAIDPSSQRSKGSILGDKTRMEELAVDSLAFIRPSPSAGSLGGVSRKTRESIILCEAAEFNVIFVETVGVGQSETSVYGMVDFFLLLMLAGAGDELQGIKRGIMEMADAIIINKADGDNITKANLAKTEYTNALHLFPPPPSGWEPKVDTCSAVTKDGVSRIWKTVLDYIDLTKRNGYFLQKRKEQSQQIMSDYIQFQLSDSFYRYPLIKKTLPSAEQNVLEGKISAYVAAQKLLDSYLHSLSKK
jgi:LAO/AO transport system kinase